MGKLDELFNKIDEEGLYDAKAISEEKANEIIDYLYEQNGFSAWWRSVPNYEIKNHIIKGISQIVANDRYEKLDQTICELESHIDNLNSKIADLEYRLRKQRSVLPTSEETVSDGFGSTWSKKCPNCGKDEVFVVRPGKVECGNCGY